MQQGRYVGKLIRRRIVGKNGQRPFRYFDKGNMAVVGKGFAIVQSGRLKMSGFLAWLAWAAVHLEFLAQPGLRLSVFVQWIWTFVTGQRGSRLIVDFTRPEAIKSIPAKAASTAAESQPPVTAVVSSK
jgi:NADH dehydrogenase